MRIAINISPLSSKHSYRGIGVYTQLLVEALARVGSEHDYILIRDNKPVDADVVHYPFFDFFFLTLPLIRTSPTVVTVHDTIPLIFPEYYPPGLRGRAKFLVQKTALRSCSAIVADSQQSCQDVVTYLKISASKVFPVYLAAHPDFSPADSESKKAVISKYHLPQRVFRNC